MEYGINREYSINSYYDGNKYTSSDYVDRVSKELFSYMPPLTKRPDFDEFWEETKKKAYSVPLDPKREVYDYPCDNVTVYKISYNGFDTTRINGWFIVPTFMNKDKYPCLIHYHGYGGNMGRPAAYMQWVLMGVAVLAVDCRGQNGATGDNASYSGGSTQAVACKGILNKEEYYFRAVYMDCVKAIDFAVAQEEVDDKRIIIEGGSQGGALGMAVCALDDRPCLAMVDVPSNSDLVRRVEGAHGAFKNVTEYLKAHPYDTDRVFETLSYFDTMNMADKIKCKVLASVGLKDETCPAIMYMATYNRIKSEKEIRIYPFNGHEGGNVVHNEIKLKFLSDFLKSNP
ncbi:MAG TPA: acetylxylan esterase [Clostridiaceae bacterium]|nr:acetylxylan esterase [Clostridiaceae bacterium]